MHFPRAFSLSFLLVFLGACGGGSGPAAPPPTAPPQAAWSQPTPVVTFDARSGVETVQPDAAGGLTVQWTQSTGLPGFAHRQPSGIWTQLPSISADACNTQAWTMGASGVDSVLLSQRISEWTSTLAVTRFTDGAWSAPAPVALVEESCYASLPVTYDAQRRLAFRGGGNSSVPTVTRYDPAAGGWQPVEQLSALPGTTQVFGPYGVIAADGRMMATWSMKVDGRIKNVYHTFRPGKGWSEPAVLPGIDEYGTWVNILAGAGGNFLMAYASIFTRPHEMLLRRFNMDTGWEEPILVASELARSSRNQLLAWNVYQGDGGHILATWTHWALLADGSIVTETWSRFYDPATGWAPPVRAPREVTDSLGTAIQISPSGKVIVASESGISTLDGNGNWVTVDPPPPRPNRGNSFRTYFAIEPSGAITAVWDERLENNRVTFMSSTYR